MGEKKRKEAAKQSFVFERKNYKFMLIGIAVIILEFILMTGFRAASKHQTGTGLGLRPR